MSSNSTVLTLYESRCGIIIPNVTKYQQMGTFVFKICKLLIFATAALICIHKANQHRTSTTLNSCYRLAAHGVHNGFVESIISSVYLLKRLTQFSQTLFAYVSQSIEELDRCFLKQVFRVDEENSHQVWRKLVEQCWIFVHQTEPIENCLWNP